MTETRRRAKVADFTQAVIEDGIGMLMKNSKRDGPDYLKVFMPLHYRYVLLSSVHPERLTVTGRMRCIPILPINEKGSKTGSLCVNRHKRTTIAILPVKTNDNHFCAQSKVDLICVQCIYQWWIQDFSDGGQSIEGLLRPRVQRQLQLPRPIPSINVSAIFQRQHQRHSV